MYLIFTNVNGYFEEINENKSWTLVSTNESKDEKYMKIKFDTDGKLPLNEKIEIRAAAVRAVFYENNKVFFSKSFFRWISVWYINGK